jgi:S1-C subfamily serine protease
MEGALEIHAGYPGNKKDLAGKTGPKPMWASPEQIPENKGKPNIRLADGSRGGCVHCHNAHDAVLWTLRAANKPIPDRMIYYFPMPDLLGFSLDPKERAAVTAVKPGTPAEKAGLKPGDKIAKMEGQPILSIADVQWVLQQAKDGSPVKIEVDRDGQREMISLDLVSGWRSKANFTWREWTWGIRHRLLGTEPLETTTDGGSQALRVKGFPPDWVKNKNPSATQFQKGDVIVDVDGKTFTTEAELLAYLMMKKAPGSVADFTVTRGGKKAKVGLKIP